MSELEKDEKDISKEDFKKTEDDLQKESEKKQDIPKKELKDENKEMGRNKNIIISLTIALLFLISGFIISPWLYGYNQFVFETIEQKHKSEYILDVATVGIKKGGEEFLKERRQLEDTIMPLRLPDENKILMNLIIGKRYENVFWEGAPSIDLNLSFGDYLYTGNESRRWNFYIKNGGKKPLSLKLSIKFNTGKILGGTSNCGSPYIPDDRKEMELFILRSDPGDNCTISSIVEGEGTPILDIESRENPRIRIIEPGAIFVVYPEDVDVEKIEKLTNSFLFSPSGSQILKKF